MAISTSLFIHAEPVVPMYIQTGAGGLLHKYALKLNPALQDALGEPIIIEFKPGANGMVANKFLANDHTNKLTLMFGMAQASADVGVDQATDLIPVLDLGSASADIVASKSSEITSLKDLIEKAKTKSYSFGVPNGSVNQNWVHDFAKVYNLQIIEVPFRTGTEGIENVAGEHLDLSVASVEATIPFAQKNMVSVLAVMSAVRTDQLPGIPTTREAGAGYPNDERGFIRLYLFANPGANMDMVNKIRKNFTTWAKTSEAQELFKRIDLGLDINTVDHPSISLKRIFSK